MWDDDEWYVELEDALDEWRTGNLADAGGEQQSKPRPRRSAAPCTSSGGGGGGCGERPAGPSRPSAAATAPSAPDSPTHRPRTPGSPTPSRPRAPASPGSPGSPSRARAPASPSRSKGPAAASPTRSKAASSPSRARASPGSPTPSRAKATASPTPARARTAPACPRAKPPAAPGSSRARTPAAPTPAPPAPRPAKAPAPNTMPDPPPMPPAPTVKTPTTPGAPRAGGSGGGGGGGGAAAEALVPQLREEAAALRAALDGERRAVRELRRALKKELRAVREEEARRREDCLADLRARLLHEHEAALAAQREALARGSSAELARALADRESALRLERAATQRQLAHMQQQLREARRPDHDCRHLQAEATRLRDANQQLSDRLQNLTRELQERRAAERASKAARSGAGAGGASAEALVPQLREEAAALRAALDGERRAVRELRRALKKELRAVREEEARRREDCLADLRARLQHEHEAALAAQREALARGSSAELARALADREAALRLERAATQRQLAHMQQQLRDAHRPDHDCKQLQAEAARLREANRQLSDRVQELEYSLASGHLSMLGPCVDDLRFQVEEREKEIANLRIAALEKERQIEQLNVKCQNQENIDQYCKIVNLDPVAEVDEDCREGRSSPSPSEEPSTPTTPLVAEMPADASLYSGLLRDHVELQRSHHVIELRLKMSESKARSAAARLQQLQSEAQELRELNELQEFRILELEESHDRWRAPRSPGSHDTRDVCTDTENDDVSDSGVMSLPTSEDVASDSDAGAHEGKADVGKPLLDLAPHPLLPKLSTRSPFAPFPPMGDLTVAHTALPDGDRPLSDEEILAKQLKNAECLQESGIFEEPDSVSDVCSRATQTDADLTPSHAELKAEIRKLKQYRDCVKKEQKDEGGGGGVAELASCRDQLRRLEAKVLVYESSGDAQLRLLAERLQRELALAAQVEQLGEKVARLQDDNARLEEQRCELEEAENDTRLRCQKMEHKLQTLIDKKLELHLRLKEERRASAALRGKQAEGDRWRREAHTLKDLLSRCEQRNTELEGREADLRQRLHLLHACWPAVLLWQVWSTLCATCTPRGALPLADGGGWAAVANGASPKRSPLRLRALGPSPHGSPGASPRATPSPQLLSPDPACASVSDDDASSCVSLELRVPVGLPAWAAHGRLELSPSPSPSPIRVSVTERAIQTDDTLGYLELKAAKDMEEKLMLTIKELREELSVFKEMQKDHRPNEVVSTGEGEGRYLALDGQEEEYLHKLHQLTQAEMDMLSRITELERKETAYMQTLQQADELWSELEGGYQRQLVALRASEAELRARLEAAECAQRQRHRAEHDVNELEQAVSELSVALRRAEEDRAALSAKVAHLSEALAVADGAVERLTHEVERELRPRLSQERRLTAELQRELAHRGHAYESMQDSYEAEVEKLKCQLAAAKKECLAVNNECYHLKTEVQELKNTIQELRTCMAKQKSDDEKTLVHLTNLLAEKDRELQGIVQASQDVMMRSAHDEIEEAEAEAAQALPLEPNANGGMHPSDSVCTVAELAGVSNQDDSGIGLADDGSSHVGHMSDIPTSHSKKLIDSHDD